MSSLQTVDYGSAHGDVQEWQQWESALSRWTFGSQSLGGNKWSCQSVSWITCRQWRGPEKGLRAEPWGLRVFRIPEEEGGEPPQGPSNGLRGRQWGCAWLSSPRSHPNSLYPLCLLYLFHLALTSKFYIFLSSILTILCCPALTLKLWESRNLYLFAHSHVSCAKNSAWPNVSVPEMFAKWMNRWVSKRTVSQIPRGWMTGEMFSGVHCCFSKALK